MFADNAQSEYNFITAFFGMHSTLLVPETRTPSLFSPSPSITPRANSSRAASESGRESTIDGLDKEDRATVAPIEESLTGKTSVAETAATSTADKNDKMVKAVVDGLWKNVMDPAQEYVQVSISVSRSLYMAESLIQRYDRTSSRLYFHRRMHLGLCLYWQ